MSAVTERLAAALADRYPLRGEPPYQALLTQIGLPEALRR